MWKRQIKSKTSKGARKKRWRRQINWINPVNLVINWINSVSLVSQIVCSCRLYSKDEQGMHSIRNFIHKIKSIIVYILKI